MWLLGVWGKGSPPVQKTVVSYLFLNCGLKYFSSWTWLSINLSLALRVFWPKHYYYSHLIHNQNLSFFNCKEDCLLKVKLKLYRLCGLICLTESHWQAECDEIGGGTGGGNQRGICPYSKGSHQTSHQKEHTEILRPEVPRQALLSYTCSRVFDNIHK